MEASKGGSHNSFSADMIKLAESIQNRNTSPKETSALMIKNFDDMLSGKTYSLRIHDDQGQAPTRKIRIVGREFQEKIQEINKKFESMPAKERSNPTLEHYEELLNLFTDQIKKEQVIYKVTLATGESQYSTSATVRQQMEGEGISALGKSGRVKRYVVGEARHSEPSGETRVKVIQTSVIESEEFVRTAEALQKIIAEMKQSIAPQVVMEEKHKAPESITTTQSTQKQQATVKHEKAEKSHDEVAPKKPFIEPRGKKTEISAADDEREFRREETKKDEKTQSKRADIRESEEATRATKNEEIKRKGKNN